jgi:hypothetical protein
VTQGEGLVQTSVPWKINKYIYIYIYTYTHTDFKKNVGKKEKIPSALYPKLHGGVAHEVENSEFEPQYHKKKKKN